LVHFQRTTRRYVPEDRTLYKRSRHTHRFNNLVMPSNLATEGE
jgi:hypothetical protein